MILNLLLVLLLQVPQVPQVPLPPPPASSTAALTVVVGLNDGMRLTVQDPEFSGFIEGRSGDAVLMYREKDFHGEMPLKTVSRIEFGTYKRGKPFPLKVMLRSGEQLDVESERRDFMTLRGKTDFGTVTVRHPDPVSDPASLTTRKPNRKKDLTIQYLEFPAS
jgi:hypothetical protein